MKSIQEEIKKILFLGTGEIDKPTVEHLVDLFKTKWLEMVGEDEEFALEENKPRLFQSNPTPNEMGGYSSVPFYCSLCFMSEMDIQDNKIEEGRYYCSCSIWDRPYGGKWLGWFDKKEAQRYMNELPTEQNVRNQLRAQLRQQISKEEV